MKISLLLIVICFLMPACRSNVTEAVLDGPTSGVMAAYSFCPASECKAMAMGRSTQRLPIPEGGSVYDHWCIEVLFNRKGEAQQAAVEVTQTVQTDDILSWQVGEPIYNADCGMMKDE
jgi:hypothetical protein